MHWVVCGYTVCYCSKQLTDCLEQSFLRNQQFLIWSRNSPQCLKTTCPLVCLHNIPPLVSLLSKISPVYVHAPSHFLKISSNSIFQSTLSSSKCPTSLSFPTKSLYAHLLLTLTHLYNILSAVQIMKLPTLQPPAVQCYVIPLTFKYATQHPIPKHPQYDTPRYTPCMKTRIFIFLCVLNFINYWIEKLKTKLTAEADIK
jgi:hypothetical protein